MNDGILKMVYLLWSPHNWVVVHPLHTLINQVFLFIAQLDNLSIPGRKCGPRHPSSSPWAPRWLPPSSRCGHVEEKCVEEPLNLAKLYLPNGGLMDLMVIYHPYHPKKKQKHHTQIQDMFFYNPYNPHKHQNQNKSKLKGSAKHHGQSTYPHVRYPPRDIKP